jgi:hypothetical protein
MVTTYSHINMLWILSQVDDSHRNMSWILSQVDEEMPHSRKAVTDTVFLRGKRLWPLISHYFVCIVACKFVVP